MSPGRAPRGGTAAADPLALQRRLTLALRREARQLQGPTAPEIRRYGTALARDLRADFRPWSLDRAARAWTRARVLVLADVHTFAQSSRNALRLLRALDERSSGSGLPRAVALECFSSRFQAELDAHARGRLSRERLRERVGFDQRWGFDWEPIAELLEGCRERGVKVVALDRPTELPPSPKFSDLVARDLWAAGVIVDRLAEHGQVIALVGEMHAARARLPAALVRIGADSAARLGPADVVTIHQNDDRLYWKHPHARLFRASPELWCWPSGTPWTRWQSVVDYLVGITDADDEAEADFRAAPQTAGGARREEAVSSALRHLAEFYAIASAGVGPGLAGAGVGEFEVFEAAHARELRRRLSRLPTGGTEIDAWAALRMARNERFWVEGTPFLYAGVWSPGAAGELAGFLLYRAARGLRSQRAWTWEERVAVHALGFFSSLVLNPRRELRGAPWIEPWVKSGRWRRWRRREPAARARAARALGAWIAERWRRESRHAARGRLATRLFAEIAAVARGRVPAARAVERWLKLAP